MSHNYSFIIQTLRPELSTPELRDFLNSKFEQIVDSHYANWFYGDVKSITFLDYQDKSKRAMPVYDYEWTWQMGGHRTSAQEYVQLAQQTATIFELLEVDRVALLFVKGYPALEDYCLVALTPLAPFPYYFSDSDYADAFKGQGTAKPRKQEEKRLEEELRLWLIASGVNAESQVATSKHRLDLWIPGRMILELKATKVTADDVCQAIDYYSRYQRSVLLVGSGLTNGASRGLEAINALIGDNCVMFVTWGAVKPYLASVLGIGNSSV